MSNEMTARMTWQEHLDSATSMTGRQRVIVLLSFLGMTAEGLNLTVGGLVYPAIAREWEVSLTVITTTVTVGVVAMALGGTIAGPLADRYGRKGIAITAMALFGLNTALLAVTTSVTPFVILRILACLGIGAEVPALMTIVADVVPGSRRAQMVSITFAGVAFGTIVAGFLASALIPLGGWQALVVSSGVGPLLLIPLFAFLVPESPGILVARGRPVAEVRRAVERLVPGSDPSVIVFVLPDATSPDRRRSGAAVVLSRRLLPTTLLLWLTFFIGTGIFYLILSYLPLMVEKQGFNTAQADVMVGTLGWGSLAGQLVVSLALRRVDRFLVVVSLWVLGLIILVVGGFTFILIVGGFTFGFAVLLIIAFGIGLSFAAVNAALTAVAALAYPPEACATGLGWSSTSGRAGMLVSGLLGGLILAAGWSISTIFLAMAAPVSIGIVATLRLRAHDSRR